MLRQTPAPVCCSGRGRDQSSRFDEPQAAEAILDAAPRCADGVRDASNDSLRGHAGRFVIAGGAMAIFYLSLTSLLAVIGVHFQAALIVGFLAATALHFTLQRVFVWSQRGKYALALRQQLQRYLPLVVAQYLTTAGATATLPTWLGVPVLAVYVATALAFTVLSFLFFGARVFHAAVGSRAGDGQRP